MNVDWRIATVGLAALLCACSPRVDWQHRSVPSTAFTEPQTTTVGALFRTAAAANPGKSGFAVVDEGRDAFIARVAMADLAEKTLDAQYYIWDGDMTGLILADRLMRAAERGVRVRVLIDDMYFTSTRDARIAALDAHPNIEFRVFNPVTHRGLRLWGLVSEFGRVNRRMHNKLFVMDNALAIVGGRNIADVYFGVRTDHNYRDLDVLTAGPLVGELSASFDAFWNSEWAIPIAAVVKHAPSEHDMRRMMQELTAEVGTAGYPYPIQSTVADLEARLARFRDRFTWAPGKVLVELPGAIERYTPRGDIATAIGRRLTELEHELLIESAYLILDDQAIATVEQLTARGVKVRILTNSAATNDVVAAHAGYAATRKRLLRAGVELYELRPDTDMKRDWALLAGKSRAALHTKALVFDRASVFIGSFNLDPRSASLNTEIGVVIDDPHVAGQVGAVMDEGVSSGSAFRVTLDAHDRLVWTTGVHGTAVTFRVDPETSLWHRFLAGFIGMLPIQKQL